jgi:hypothetical protein
MLKNIQKKANASWIRKGICGALFTVIAVFGFVNMHSILKGVSITADIVPATDNSKVVHVKGKVDNAIFVSLNGREIFIDQKGNFNEALALPDGYSIITLAAKDGNGTSKKNTIEVFSKQSGKDVALVSQNIIIN